MQPDFVNTKKKRKRKQRIKKTSESLWRIITLELVSIDILFMDGLGFVETDEICQINNRISTLGEYNTVTCKVRKRWVLWQEKGNLRGPITGLRGFVWKIKRNIGHSKWTLNSIRHVKHMAMTLTWQHFLIVTKYRCFAIASLSPSLFEKGSAKCSGKCWNI